MNQFSNFRFIWEMHTQTFRWLMWCAEKNKEYISYPGYKLPKEAEAYLRHEPLWGLPLDDFLRKYQL